jgi:acyl-coenzyme A synthetase/AMP-(fatty) acid ligase
LSGLGWCPSSIAGWEENDMPVSGPPLEQPFDTSKLLAKGLAAHPDAPALVSKRARWTWHELDQVSECFARNLLDLGLAPGDRVASLMPNRCEVIVFYVACMKAGLVAVPLNYRYKAPEIDHALDVSSAAVLFAHDERAEDLAASTRVGSLPLGVISYNDEGGSRSPTYAELIEGPSTRRLVDPEPTAPAVIFFTSGSTGKPKGVTHSFETLGWVIANMEGGYDIRPDDVWLPGSSMAHMGGHIFALAPLAIGARVVVPLVFDSEELLWLFRDQRPTSMWILPSALFSLVRDHGATHDDFASLKYCVSGGDKVSHELDVEFEELVGRPIAECYGMTEIGDPGVNLPRGDFKLGAVGKLTPGFDVSIRCDDGQELPVGTEGRLWVRFAGITPGYWDNPEATAEVLVDGWFDTGDMMTLDKDGFLWFHGRKKQIIVHDGSNICPQEVEEALLDHEAVEIAGVIGIHNLVHGENVRAYVTLKPGMARPSDEALIGFARQKVGYKAPEEIVVLDDMPLNATGKVDRVTLKKRAAERLDAHHPV